MGASSGKHGRRLCHSAAGLVALLVCLEEGGKSTNNSNRHSHKNSNWREPIAPHGECGVLYCPQAWIRLRELARAARRVVETDTVMDTPQSVSFGALLKRYRQAAGLTQEELAERAGLSRRGIADLERGERQTPPQRHCRAAGRGAGPGR